MLILRKPQRNRNDKDGCVSLWIFPPKSHQKQKSTVRLVNRIRCADFVNGIKSILRFYSVQQEALKTAKFWEWMDECEKKWYAKYWVILMLHQKSSIHLCTLRSLIHNICSQMRYPFNSLVLTWVFQKLFFVSTWLKWRYHIAVIVRIAFFDFFSFFKKKKKYFFVVIE